MKKVKCNKGPLQNVPVATTGLPVTGQKLEADPGSVFVPKWGYTVARENDSGNENHFQGCQRLPGGPFVAICGGSWRPRQSHLFIVEFGSRPTVGAWESNTVNGSFDRQKDRVISGVALDKDCWHSGGMDLHGNWLAIPIECGHLGFWGRQKKKIFRGVSWPKCSHGKDHSEIVFFDVTDPRSPVRSNVSIVRSDRKATAVALTKLEAVGYVVAVLSKAGKGEHKDQRRLDFYLSKSGDLSDGFHQKEITWWDDNKDFGDYQNLSFLCDAGGKLFLAAMHNPASATPLFNKKDVLDLFRVTLPKDIARTHPGGSTKPDRIKIKQVGDLGKEKFEAPRSHYNFDAGAGLFVSDEKLLLYSVRHFRSPGGLVRITEFSA